MSTEHVQYSRRKIERRVDDWKPMHGMDRRVYEDQSYYGVERRKEKRRRAQERRGYTYGGPEWRSRERRRVKERRGQFYGGPERRRSERRMSRDRRKHRSN
jgi:hypothetical protein